MRAETDRPDAHTSARILIADDHDLVRAGLRDVLADRPDIEVVGEASDGREAVELCIRLRPDLVLMDIRMPRMDGLEATREIKRAQSRVIVLVISMYENPDYLFEAIKAGAAGYVLKTADRADLLAAVWRALSGDSPLDPGLAARLLQRMVREAGDRRDANTQSDDINLNRAEDRRQRQFVESLTARELEVLELLTTGKTNRQIAQELYLSANTVKVHVQHIIAKLNVSDRTQAAALAVEMGLSSSAAAKNRSTPHLP